MDQAIQDAITQTVEKAVGAALADDGPIAKRIAQAIEAGRTDDAAKVKTMVDETVGQVVKAAVDAKLANVEAGVKPEQVEAAVKAGVDAEFAKRDEAAQKTADEAAQAQAVQDARTAFLAEKAAKIPAVYHVLVPETDKAEDLEGGLKKAVAAYQADAAKHGWKIPDIGASAAQPAGDDPKPTKTREELAKMSSAEREAHLRKVAEQG